jgi:hypothetical protein
MGDFQTDREERGEATRVALATVLKGRTIAGVSGRIDGWDGDEWGEVVIEFEDGDALEITIEVWSDPVYMNVELRRG